MLVELALLSDPEQELDSCVIYHQTMQGTYIYIGENVAAFLYEKNIIFKFHIK